MAGAAIPLYIFIEQKNTLSLSAGSVTIGKTVVSKTKLGE